MDNLAETIYRLCCDSHLFKPSIKAKHLPWLMLLFRVLGNRTRLAMLLHCF